MQAPFAPGDVVVCVDDSPCRCCGNPISVRVGPYYRVERLGVNPGPRGPFRLLILSGVPASPRHSRGVNANRFRKIDDEVDEAFREQMHSLGKPKELATPADLDAVFSGRKAA